MTSRPYFLAGVRAQKDPVRNQWIIQAPERVIELNDSSAAIVMLVDGRRSLDDIIETLAFDYQADKATVRADVVAFLNDLSARGLLTL